MNWSEKRETEISKMFFIIEKRFFLKIEKIRQKNRHRDYVSAKRFIMNILFEIFYDDKMNHEDISKVVGLDRTSFIHHRKEHLNHYEKYKDYKEDYDKLKKQFEDSLN